MDRIEMQDFLKIMSGIGNSNVLYEFIHYYHKLLDNMFETNIKPKKFIYNSPEYFVWLLLNSLYISTKIENLCIRKGIISDIDTKMLYDDMVGEIKKELSDKNKKRIYNLHLVIELRHCFVHFGLPNIIRKSNLKKEIYKFQNNYKFAYNVFKESDNLLNQISVPQVSDPTGSITIREK